MKKVIALLACLVTGLALAATPPQYTTDAQKKAGERRATLATLKEGDQYTLINPAGKADQPTVVEFFSYTCGHCFAMESFLGTWKKEKPGNVNFQRMHVVGMFGEQGDMLAKAFYTAEVLGIIEKVHQPFFDLIHVDKKMPKSDAEIAAYFAKFGVKEEVVLSTMKSFAVNMKMGQAKQALQKYRLRGVPGFVINDKYFADGKTAKNLDMLDKVLSEVPLR